MIHGRALSVVLVLTALCMARGSAHAQGGLKLPDWSVNATVIAACSCPMMCPAHFGTRPAAQAEGLELKRFCRFNEAYKVNSGSYGKTSLDGALFWLAGDRGADFSAGQMDWAVLTFDKSLGNEQREGISAIVGFLYPIRFRSVNLSEAEIAWNGAEAEAQATLDQGRTAQIQLKRLRGIADGPVLLQNLRYWGTTRNDGYVLLPCELQAYRVGPRPFEFRDSTGFMVTFDMSSKDPLVVQAAAGN
jgi:hypothetical protein